MRRRPRSKGRGRAGRDVGAWSLNVRAGECPPQADIRRTSRVEIIPLIPPRARGEYGTRIGPVSSSRARAVARPAQHRVATSRPAHLAPRVRDDERHVRSRTASRLRAHRCGPSRLRPLEEQVVAKQVAASRAEVPSSHSPSTSRSHRDQVSCATPSTLRRAARIRLAESSSSSRAGTRPKPGGNWSPNPSLR